VILGARFVVIRCALALAAALPAAGCRGSEPGPVPDGVVVSTDDLAQLIAVLPGATGWTAKWAVVPSGPERRLRADLDKSRLYDPADPSFEMQATLADALKEARYVEGRQRAWSGAREDEADIAHSFATVLAPPQGAQTALDASRAFAEDWYTTIEHQQIRDVDVAEGLGDASWALEGGTKFAGFAELAWVRGNAQLSVYVNCTPCDGEPATAARQWADAIDAKLLAVTS
jgi:hypothetical protein